MNDQQLPKIYITKLPTEQIKEEPEIFFTKLSKEKQNSVAVIDKDDNDNEVINEDILEPAIRSDHVYQDGLENVNAMIYNSQAVNTPTNTFNGKKQPNDFSPVYPYLEYVSSTARIIGDNNCNDKEESDLTKLDSADKMQPSTPTNNEDWVLPVVIIASITIVILLTFSVGRVHFCLPVRNLFHQKNGGDNKAKNALAKFLISKTFASWRKNKISSKYSNIWWLSPLAFL